jgi:sodium-coupled neutral amino acid transporter 11
MIVVPYYVAVCGWSFGLFLLWALALPSFATLILQHKLAQIHGATSQAELCSIAFGAAGDALANFSSFMYNYGGFIGGLLVIGDTVPHLVRSYATDEINSPAVRTTTLLLSAVVVTPFALRKDIADLSFLGVLCFLACVLLTVCLAYIAAHEAWVHSSPADKEYSKSQWPEHGNAPSWSFLHAIGGFTYLYTCQDIAFPIANSLVNNTTRRFAIVVALTLFVTLSLLTVTAVSAAMLFGSAASRNNDNVLANFEPRCPPAHYKHIKHCSHDAVETFIANVCRAFIAFAVLATTPQSLYMPRRALIAAVKPLRSSSTDSDETETEAPHSLHIIATLALLVLGLLVALAVTDLSGTFSFIGGVAGIAMTVCLPCCTWLRLAAKDEWQSYGLLHCMCSSLLALGVFAIGTSLLDVVLPGAIPDETSFDTIGTAAGRGHSTMPPYVEPVSVRPAPDSHLLSDAAARFRNVTWFGLCRVINAVDPSPVAC